MNQLYDRISAVEDFVVMCNSKFDGFGKELGDLSTDVRTVLEWISQHFGTELECSRNRVHPQRIEIEIVTTPAPSSNTATAETNTEGPFRVGDAIMGMPNGGNDIQSEIQSSVVHGDDTSQVEDESVHSDAFDEGSDGDDHIPDPTPKPRRRVRSRKHSEPTGPAGLSANEDVAAEDSDTVVTIPKRGRPCKPILQNKKADPQPSQCDQCGKILKDAGSLRQHKATHKDVRPHVCPECGKAFRRKFHLKTHSLIHSGEKKHQCGYCGKLFLLPKDLVAHERIHTGERPYSCSMCMKSFNLKSHLKMHVRTHTGEKPYKCDLCEKAFSQSNSLRVHKKVHLKNQNNTANLGRERASTSSTLDVTRTGALSTTTQNNNNLYQSVDRATSQQYPQGRASTSRETTEPVIFEIDHQNVYSTSVQSKNTQLPQDTAGSHLRVTEVLSHHSLVSKSFQTNTQIHSTNVTSKSGDQLISSIRNSNVALANDGSHIIVSNSSQPPSENDNHF